ncbi:GNAT family N-acetyltransferase [Geodermatophilus sp. DSM 44513]|uniref:GNAT family N-acetyltransferase n=1 Tax=Geodermatophilus sp. DSM 44513 TaxID=1528104 RepID=UPI0012893279
MEVTRLGVDDGPAVLGEVLGNTSAFWGDRDTRQLHHPVWWRQFADDAFVAHDGDEVVGYLLGVTRAPIGYVHLIATRHDRRGLGVGRRLYAAFTGHARERGAVELQAITTTANTGSIRFHERLGFTARVVDDYAGPGEPRVLFSLPLQ